MNSGRLQPGEEDLKEPKRKKVKPGAVLKNPYPIIFWNKVGIPPCNDLWPNYCGIFDGESVIIEYPEDMSDIYSMGYFGKRMLYRRGGEPNIRDLPVLRERQWKRRVEWAAEFGYVLVPAEEDQEEDSSISHQSKHNSGSPVQKDDEGEPSTRNRKTANSTTVNKEKNEKHRKGKTEQKQKEMESSSDLIDINESEEVDIAQDETRTSDDCVNIPEDSLGDADCCVIEKPSVRKSGLQQMPEETVEVSTRDSTSNSEVVGVEIAEKKQEKVVERGVKGQGRLVAEASAGDVESDGVEMDRLEENTDMECVDDEKRDLEVEEAEAIPERSESDCVAGGEVDDVGKEKSCGDSHQRVERAESELRETIEKIITAEECSKKVYDNGEGKDPREELEEKGGEGSKGLLDSSTLNKAAAEVDDDKEKEEVQVVEGGEENPSSITGESESTPKCDVEKGVAEKDVTSSKESTDVQQKKPSTCDSEIKNNAADSEWKKELNKEDENVTVMIDSETSTNVIEDKRKNATSEGNKSQLDSSTMNKGMAEADNAKRKEDLEVVEEACTEENKSVITGESKSTPKCDVEKDVVEKDVTSSKESSDIHQKKPSTCDSETKNDETGSELKKELSKEVENATTMNDSEASIEIIEDERKHATPEKFYKGDDKNLKEKVRKRNIESVEVEVFDEERDAENGRKRKKMEGEDVEESDKKENSGKDKESLEKEDPNTLQEEGKSKEKRKSSEEDVNSSMECEIVEIEDERNSGSMSLEVKRKSVEERYEDSDDDIMEVSMDEGDRAIHSKSRKTKRGIQNTNITERYLNEIRKKLPKGIELLQVHSGKQSAKAEVGKESESKKVCKETPEENDDDDVIEIEQKNEMSELKEVDEDSMECEYFDHRANEQKMRREKKGSFQQVNAAVEETCDDDEVISVEMEDRQSLVSNVKSECELFPCIVIPDTDSEDENAETEKAPRLESDPSLYLPTLDILRLLPEEAFFLAYGLGCLEVWDGRIEKAEEPADGDGTKDIEITKKTNAMQDCHKMVKKEDEKVQLKEDESQIESCNSNSSKKFTKENLIKESNSSKKSLSESIHVECENLDSATPKLGSVSDKIEIPASVPLSSNSNDAQTIDSEEQVKDSKSKDIKDEIGEVESVEQVVVTPADKNKANRLSKDSPAVSDKPGHLTNRKTASQEIDTDKISGTEQINNVNSCDKMENGSITVIDLADSPPARQWGDQESSDEDDVIDVDHPNVSCPSSQPIESKQMSDSTLNCGHDNAMSLIDLWNAFRLSRSSTSPSATPFETTYAVYHHFRAKSWVVKPGTRFGGDFLLYKDGPSFYHASYLVVIDSSPPHEKSRLNWNTLAGMNRLAENVAKELMICRVEWPKSITETQLRSPKCLAGLTVEEILVRRWVSMKERDSHEEVYDVEKDCDFIPLDH